MCIVYSNIEFLFELLFSHLNCATYNKCLFLFYFVPFRGKFELFAASFPNAQTTMKFSITGFSLPTMLQVHPVLKLYIFILLLCIRDLCDIHSMDNIDWLIGFTPFEATQKWHWFIISTFCIRCMSFFLCLFNLYFLLICIVVILFDFFGQIYYWIRFMNLFRCKKKSE